MDKRGKRLINLPKSRLGDISEIVVHAYCLLMGYEVYPNASCVGKTDMVVDFRFGEPLRIDVKTKAWSSAKGYLCNVKKRIEGVHYVFVDPSDWSITWGKGLGKNTPQCPEGYEHVWSLSLS